MPRYTCYKLGDGANDIKHDMYYRGQRIREAYYRGEQIWGGVFVGILLVRLPDKLHYPGMGTLTKIEVTRPPDRTEYGHGEDFDYSGAVITANYTDGSAVDITSQCTFTPATDILAFNANVHMESSNTENEPLDYTGIKVLGLWSDGYTEDITEKCEFYPEEGTLINKSTALIGIIVARLPNKTTYNAGDFFDYSGVVVVAVYADGHTVDITDKCVFNPTSEKPVSVKHVHMVCILVTKTPTGTGDDPYEGVEVTAVYSNGQTVDVTSECVFSYGS